VISLSYLSIKLWFHTKGKLAVVLIIPSSWGFPTGPVRHQATTSLGFYIRSNVHVTPCMFLVAHTYRFPVWAFITR
jgi:hypothetical protein